MRTIKTLSFYVGMIVIASTAASNTGSAQGPSFQGKKWPIEDYISEASVIVIATDNHKVQRRVGNKAGQEGKIESFDVLEVLYLEQGEEPIVNEIVIYTPYTSLEEYIPPVGVRNILMLRPMNDEERKHLNVVYDGPVFTYVDSLINSIYVMGLANDKSYVGGFGPRVAFVADLPNENKVIEEYFRALLSLYIDPIGAPKQIGELDDVMKRVLDAALVK